LEAVVGAPVCPNNPVDVVDIPKVSDFVDCVPVCPNMPEDELGLCGQTGTPPVTMAPGLFGQTGTPPVTMAPGLFGP
jgi:hypothetical protein